MEVGQALLMMVMKAFSFVVWLVSRFLYYFIGYIDACDAVLTTLLVYFIVRNFFAWGKGWALLLALLTALIVYIIFKHPIGFWVVTLVYSVMWGIAIASFVLMLGVIVDHTFSDLTLWVIAIITFPASGWFHYCARYRKQVEAEMEADELAQGRRS